MKLVNPLYPNASVGFTKHNDVLLGNYAKVLLKLEEYWYRTTEYDNDCFADYVRVIEVNCNDYLFLVYKGKEHKYEVIKVYQGKKDEYNLEVVSRFDSYNINESRSYG